MLSPLHISWIGLGEGDGDSKGHWATATEGKVNWGRTGCHDVDDELVAGGLGGGRGGGV